MLQEIYFIIFICFAAIFKLQKKYLQGFIAVKTTDSDFLDALTYSTTAS